MKLQVQLIYQAEVLTRAPLAAERTTVVRRSRSRILAVLAARFAAFKLARRTAENVRVNWRVAQVPTWGV
jgi:hypothetical protein